ncbi:AroM family protein [Alicyclobacillus kakegawensis]|uniref:AroM family protein n=1 Tax=Alicyclobacillus kakegawensis TaxID=392012 RepID=UPI0014706382|nr:AroM family protein [Alicyclobacillus kakegawensis]
MLITIGESPRPDPMDALGLAGHDGVTFIGALDTLREDQVAELRWNPDDEDLPIFTWFRGQEVILGRRRLYHRLRQVVSALPKRPSLIAILCTESFPGVGEGDFVLRIDKLLTQTVSALTVGHTRLGVFVPVLGQVAAGEARWNLFAQSAACCLPPRSDESQIRESCRLMRERLGGTPHLIVLDCMGYTRQDLQTVSEEFDCTIIWPAELVRSILHRHMNISP